MPAGGRSVSFIRGDMLSDPSARFAASLDGMPGSSTYSQVMGAARRGAANGRRGWATNIARRG